MTALSPRPCRFAAPRGWCALWLVTLVFLAQLFAATRHDHDLGAASQHCVACALHAQPDASAPPATLSVAPQGWPLVQVLAAVKPVPAPRRTGGYLLPPAQAPPASAFPY